MLSIFWTKRYFPGSAKNAERKIQITLRLNYQQHENIIITTESRKTDFQALFRSRISNKKVKELKLSLPNNERKIFHKISRSDCHTLHFLEFYSTLLKFRQIGAHLGQTSNPFYFILANFSILLNVGTLTFSGPVLILIEQL